MSSVPFAHRSDADAVRHLRVDVQDYNRQVRQSLPWIPEEYRLPSRRVWSILERGSGDGNPFRDVQSVVTGLVNAGWDLFYIRHVLDVFDSTGSPGRWLKLASTIKQHPRALHTSYEKAVERVRRFPAQPWRARSDDPERQDRVLCLVQTLEVAFVSGARVNGVPLLPGGREAVPARRFALALVEHVRRLSSVLEVSPDGRTVYVAASGRDVGLLANRSGNQASEHLKRFARAELFVRYHDMGRRFDDAFTYELFLPRFLLLKPLGGLKRPDLPQPSRGNMGGLVDVPDRRDVPPRIEMPPQIAIWAHDAFASPSPKPGTPAGLGGTSGFIVALVAANPGIDTAEITRACGLSAGAITKAVRQLTACTDNLSDPVRPLLEYSRRDGWTLAVTTEGALLDELDHIALATGTLGTQNRRAALVDRERRAYLEHHTGRSERDEQSRLSERKSSGGTLTWYPLAPDSVAC